MLVLCSTLQQTFAMLAGSCRLRQWQALLLEPKSCLHLRRGAVQTGLVRAQQRLVCANTSRVAATVSDTTAAAGADGTSRRGTLTAFPPF